MDYPRIIHGLSMDYPWMIHGLSTDNPWIMHGLSMDYPCIIHGLSMDFQIGCLSSLGCPSQSRHPKIASQPAIFDDRSHGP